METTKGNDAGQMQLSIVCFALASTDFLPFFKRCGLNETAYPPALELGSLAFPR